MRALPTGKLDGVVEGEDVKVVQKMHKSSYGLKNLGNQEYFTVWFKTGESTLLVVRSQFSYFNRPIIQRNLFIIFRQRSQINTPQRVQQTHGGALAHIHNLYTYI